MKKNLLCFLMLFSLTAFSQIKFENGYYVNNVGEKISGLIKNVDWKNNPNTFEFKIDNTSEIQVITIDQAQEFAINNVTHYLRRDIDMEKSSVKINSIGNTKEPQFINQRVFLKEIVSGTCKLYKYEETGVEKFFYSVNDSEIKQLIYIKYKATEEDIKNNSDLSYSTILTNDYFKRQLWSDVKCESTSQKDLKYLEYNQTALYKYFTKINQCSGNVSNETKNISKTSYNLKVAGAYNISSLSVNDFSPSYSPEFSDSSFGFGFEAEIILPFNNNKWGVILEPSYNTFKGEKTSLPPFGLSLKPEVASSDIKYFQIPLGIRHYFYLNNNSKIFLNAIANTRIINKKSIVEYESARGDLSFSNTTFSFAAGIGYNYKKISCELRYFFKSNISPYPYTAIDFNNTAFILRYEVFRNK